MKAFLLFVLICTLTVLPVCSQDQDRVGKRGKTETIGKTLWYTEQNTFDEVLTIAQKKNKPVLAVFSATWCGPCQKVKKEVFASDGFQEVAKKALLLYIEQTEPKAARIIKKNNIRSYPTFKLFANTGKLLHAGYFGMPRRTVKGFSQWIDKAMAGAIKPLAKKKKIHGVEWFTEQISIKDLSTKAQKEGKLILIMYPDPRPGNEALQEEILGHESFKKTVANYIPITVDFTKPGGRDYLSQYRPRGYPTFLVVSAEGKLMERWAPREKSARGFLDWFKAIRAQGGFHDQLKRLEKYPDNIDLIMEVTTARKFDYENKFVELLLHAIKLKPDVSDPTTQKAYERIVPLICRNLYSFMENSFRRDYIDAYNDIVMKAYEAYYPDKFKYQLSTYAGYRCIIQWLCAAEKYTEALKYYDEFKEWAKLRSLEAKLIRMTGNEAIPALLRKGREMEALKISGFLTKEGKADFSDAKRHEIRPFVTYYVDTGQLEKAEALATPIMNAYLKDKKKPLHIYIKTRYAMDFGVFAGEVIKYIDETGKTAKRSSRIRMQLEKAKILARTGKKEAAQKLFDTIIQELLDKGIKNDYNQCAWAMVEADMVTSKTLELAKKAAAEHENHAILDTLASTHAALGNYKEAVKFQGKALSLLTREYERRSLERKLIAWNRLVK